MRGNIFFAVGNLWKSGFPDQKGRKRSRMEKQGMAVLSGCLVPGYRIGGQPGSCIVRINPLLLHFYVRVENLLPVLFEFDEDDEGCVRLFYQTPAEGSEPPCHCE